MTDDERNRVISELARKLWTKLRRYAERLGAIDADAAVADAFDALLKAWSQLPGINATPAPSIDAAPSWLHTTVRNKVCTQHRRRGSERNAVVRMEDDPTTATTASSAEREAMTNEAVRTVYEAIQRLPPRQRDIVTLRLLFHYSYEEIAKELGVSIGNVKAQLSRAYRKLRGFLDE